MPTAQPRRIVSVVIPTWNRRASLVTSIASCIAQTVAPDEVLVVDDHGDAPVGGWLPDALATALPAGLGDRVRVLRTSRNGGPGAARNLGLEHSRGDLVLFNDSDDFWSPVRIEHALHLDARTPADVWVTAFLHPDGSGNFSRWLPAAAEFDLHAWMLGLASPFAPPCMALARAGRALRFREDMRLGEDFEFGVRALASGLRVRFANRTLTFLGRPPAAAGGLSDDASSLRRACRGALRSHRLWLPLAATSARHALRDRLAARR